MKYSQKKRKKKTKNTKVRFDGDYLYLPGSKCINRYPGQGQSMVVYYCLPLYGNDVLKTGLGILNWIMYHYKDYVEKIY